MAFDALTHAEDEDLLQLYAAGDPGAAKALTRRLGPLSFRLAFRLLGTRDAAEDVAQEAMLRLWRAAPGWRKGEAKVSTWLYTVTRNLCTDRQRAFARRATTGLDEAGDPVDPTPGAEAQMIIGARETALREALQTLPDRQREAVVLRHIEGLSNPEIAEIMDITTEAVESLIARGKRGLAAALAGRRTELGYDDD